MSTEQTMDLVRVCVPFCVFMAHALWQERRDYKSLSWRALRDAENGNAPKIFGKYHNTAKNFNINRNVIVSLRSWRFRWHEGKKRGKNQQWSRNDTTLTCCQTDQIVG